MEKHKNDILKLMDLDFDQYKDIQFDLLIDMFYAYIKEFNCYEKLCLLMMNKMLQQIGLNEIENIKDFKIERKKMVKIDGHKLFDQHILILKLFFDLNKDLNYYQKHRIKIYSLSLLNAFLKKCEVELKSYNTNFCKTEKKIYTIDTIYYILPKS